jgi:CheY-like chemotaxis protein
VNGQGAAHLLVVDDEREKIRFLGTLLGDHGYQVHVAESGEQALAAAEEIGGEVRLDLILVAILMPGTLDGRPRRSVGQAVC